MSTGEVLNERETLEGVMSMCATFQLDDSSGDEEDEDVLLLAAATVAHLEDAGIDPTAIKSVRGAVLLLDDVRDSSVCRLSVPAKRKRTSITIERKRICPKYY